MTPALAHRLLARRLADEITWRRVAVAALIVLLGPALPVGCLRWVEPPTTAFIVERRLAGLVEPVPPIRYQWVSWRSISHHVPLAAVAAEDQRFPHHFGFDLDAVEAALQERASGRRSRGASTISQQVAKNLFLWPGRSWVRKGVEAWLTLWIEALWPKRRILEMYVNIAEFGDGIYGVEAAAHHYFGKTSAELSQREAARLAAVLPSPRRYRVIDPGDWVRARVEWIVRQMRQLGPGHLGDAWPVPAAP